MVRLQKGENKTIDRINDLVAIIKSSNCDDRNDAMVELLDMFKPMIISVCDKWSKYFNDTQHKIKPFDDLLSDARYWFIKYTIEKYVIDGDATYNKFIKDHIDQRIRYIYECQLKYYNKLIFPDPDKNQDSVDTDTFESVIYNYSSNISDQSSMEDDIIDRVSDDKRIELAQHIMHMVENGRFNDREKRIFIDIMCNGVTQDEMSKRLGISRTRVVQILRKIKYKLRQEMELDNKFWELMTQTDITFNNNYL